MTIPIDCIERDHRETFFLDACEWSQHQDGSPRRNNFEEDLKPLMSDLKADVTENLLVVIKSVFLSLG